MKYLIVAAHPDDEVLGAGATLKKLISNCNEVSVCIMSSEALRRASSPKNHELIESMEKCHKFLGIANTYKGSFPNIEMNTVSHIELVQFIEAAIIDCEPDVVITHHPADVNNDHCQTSLACQAAVRLFQRRPSVSPISEFWYMEVLSSTEWSLNKAITPFAPNVFIEIGASGLEEKIKALEFYPHVMREFPHPRSREVIRAMAALRGAQSGFMYAEGFECVMRRMKDL